MSTRTAVVWIPDWPLVVARAVHNVDEAVPAIVIANRKVRVASGYARAVGIRTGMALRHAQELCPEVVVLESDELIEAREFEYVAQLVEQAVPHVDILRPGLLAFGAFGPTRYFGTEEKLASTIVDILASQAQCEAYVGYGEGLLAAILSARTFQVIPVGMSPAFIQNRPLSEVHYALTDTSQRSAVRELVALWSRLGITTFGQLAALPKTQVTTRFGVHGEYIYGLACGYDIYGTRAQRSRPEITVSLTLDPPATRVDEAAFSGRKVAQKLYDALLSQSATCGRITISARMSDGTELHRSWRTDDTALGAMSPERIAQRVRWQLEGWLTNSALREQVKVKQEMLALKNRPQPNKNTQTQLSQKLRAQLDYEDAREHQTAVELSALELIAQDVTGASTHQESLWGARTGNDTRARSSAERVASLIGPHNVQAVHLTGGRTYQDRFTLVPWDSEVIPSAPRPQAPTTTANPVATTPSLFAHTSTQPAQTWPGNLPSPGPTLVVNPPQHIEVLDSQQRPVRFTNRLAMSGAPATMLWLGENSKQLCITQWAGPWPITTGWWRTHRQRALYFQFVPEHHQALLVAYSHGSWQCEGIYD